MDFAESEEIAPPIPKPIDWVPAENEKFAIPPDEQPEEVDVESYMAKQYFQGLFGSSNETQAVNPKKLAGDQKTRMDLLPLASLKPVADVLAHGADKYGIRNYRKQAITTSTYIAAILRHLEAIQRGETIDPDSGRQHFAHIAASAVICLEADRLGKLEDDTQHAEVKYQ